MKGGFPKHLSGWHRPIQKSVFEHAEAHIAVDKILKKPMKLVKNLSLNEKRCQKLLCGTTQLNYQLTRGGPSL